MRQSQRSRRTRAAIGVAVTAASVATLLGCAQPAETASTTLTIRSYGLTGNWDPLHGANLEDNSGHAEAIYEPLLMASVEGLEYIPWLASEYEIGEDRRTVTMSLREDVDFTDGVHLDAEGVARFLDASAGPDASSVYKSLVENYGTAVEATGEYTLEFSTHKPVDLVWLDYIAFMPIASPEAIEDPESLARNPVGTGPYVLGDEVPEASVTYIRNPDYWNPEAYPFDTVVVKVFDDDIAALNALKSGQLDATFVSQLPLAVEAETAGFALFLGVGLFPSLFIMDREGAIQPALADVRVRQAMNMAFDREAINESLNLGLGRVTSQPFLEGEELWVEDGDDYYEYDLDRARELMAEAGYADGFDLVVPTLSGEYTGTYEPVLAQSLADIGIRVTYDRKPDPGALFGDAWPNGEYAVAAYTFLYGETTSWIELFWGGYKSADALALADIVENGSAEEARDAKAALGRLILEQAWFVPFSAPPGVVAARPGLEVDVAGTRVNPMLWQFTPSD